MHVIHVQSSAAQFPSVAAASRRQLGQDQDQEHSILSLILIYEIVLDKKLEDMRGGGEKCKLFLYQMMTLPGLSMKSFMGRT